MALHDKLQELRKEKDLSQDEVGRAVGVDQRNVSGWESGKTKPSLENAAKLAKLFGVSIDYLVFDNVPREGFEAINDFDLYQKFRETEKLEPEDKKFVAHLIDLVLLKVRFKDVLRDELSGDSKQSAPAFRKVSGKR
jgi:transcriptional regulator with XRE-family HTH domain